VLALVEVTIDVDGTVRLAGTELISSQSLSVEQLSHTGLPRSEIERLSLEHGRKGRARTHGGGAGRGDHVPHAIHGGRDASAGHGRSEGAHGAGRFTAEAREARGARPSGRAASESDHVERIDRGDRSDRIDRIERFDWRDRDRR
jgi:hypothetical protein